MTGSIWLPCCDQLSMKLVIDLMEYIFIHAKKDVITEKNNEMKNSKEKRQLQFSFFMSAKGWRSGEVLMNLFIYLKKCSLRKIRKYVNL